MLAPVDLDREVRNAGIEQTEEQPDHEQPQRAGGHRQHHRLGHELSNDAAPAGAECEPHGDLAPARDAETGEQRADVRARDQQDEHGKHQGDHRAGRGPLIGARRREVVAGDQRDDVGGRDHAGRPRRHLLRRPCGDRLDGRARLIGAHAGLQARHETEAGLVITGERQRRALDQRTRAERQPDAHLRPARPRAGESARRDAGDRDRDAVDFHRTAVHVRRAIEVSLPQRVADHGDERRRGVGVVRLQREARAECRDETEHLEIVAGDVGRGAALRVRFGGAGVEDDIGRRPRGDGAEQRPLRCVLPILGIREFAADRAARLGAIDAADPDERLLARDARHRTVDERLDEQQQRGAEADAEREDPDHRRGDNRRAREVTDREANVLDRVFDHVHASHVPARFLRLLDAAEGAHRRLTGLLGRHAAGDILRHAPVDVVADLVVEFLLDAVAAEHRSQSKPQGGQQAP